MKDNTTNLSNEEYYQLRNFKEKVISGYGVNIWSGFGSGKHYFFYKPDEMAKKLLKENGNLRDQLLTLEEKDEPKEKSVTEIKKMSIWQFIKWRKKQK